MIENLSFKNTEMSLEYVEKYFQVLKLKLKESYYGKIIHIDKSKAPFVYIVEVLTRNDALFFPKIKRKSVVGIKHNDLTTELCVDDFVLWGCDDLTQEMPFGFILYALQNQLNLTSKVFQVRNG